MGDSGGDDDKGEGAAAGSEGYEPMFGGAGAGSSVQLDKRDQTIKKIRKTFYCII